MKLQIFIFIMLSSLVGCSTASVEYVYLPQKCDTTIPSPIKPTGNLVKDVKLITERLEIMECKVRYCKGEVLSQCEGKK